MKLPRCFVRSHASNEDTWDMIGRLPLLLVAAVLGAAFVFAEHGNRTRIVAPDKPDRSSTFAGTVNGADGSRELGKRMINSERSPLF